MKSVRTEGCHMGLFREFVGTACCTYGQSNTTSTIISLLAFSLDTSLHWRHNENVGVSNHQSHGCLLNRLLRRRSKKTSKLRTAGLCAGNSPGTGDSPHKWSVSQKMFPFDDVIMLMSNVIINHPRSGFKGISFCRNRLIDMLPHKHEYGNRINHIIVIVKQQLCTGSSLLIFLFKYLPVRLEIRLWWEFTMAILASIILLYSSVLPLYLIPLGPIAKCM